MSPPLIGEAAINSVVDAAVATPDLSVLVEAVLAAGFADGPLSDPSAEITVLAPVNDAFVALLGALGADSLDDLDISLVQDVLSYHVIPGGKVLSTDLMDGMEAGTLLDAGLTVDLSDGVIFKGIGSDAAVIAADIEVGNAVVHLIDTVLLPISLEGEDEEEPEMVSAEEALAMLPSYLANPKDIYEAAPPSDLPLNAPDDVVVGECSYMDWAAGPFYFEYGVPALDVKLYQGVMDGEPMLYSTMQGYLGPLYDEDVAARTGAPTVIAHAYSGVCDPVINMPLAGLGAHWNFDTDVAYGQESNEIWYNAEGGDFGSVNFKTPMKDWVLPGAEGQVPNRLIASFNSTGPLLYRGAKGNQGNVPGSVVLHYVDDDGSPGIPVACCALSYMADFCDDIGGCSIYDPRTDPSTLGLDRSPGVGQPYGYVSPPLMTADADD